MPYRWHIPVRIAALAVVFAALAAAGCAQIRKLTYPPDFVYLTRQDVNTGMYRIAGHMDALNALLNEVPSADDPDPLADRMLAHVDGIGLVIRELGAGASGTNHLLIDAHRGEFVDAIERTRVSLQNVPPRFYEVGRLVGSCNACHRFR